MLRKFLVLAGLALVGIMVAAACGGDDNVSQSSPTAQRTAAASTTAAPAATTAAAAADMQLPPGAENMKVAIAAPADGTKVTANSVALLVDASGYDLTCDLAGKPLADAKGHYHVLLDKALVNMFCTKEAVISMQNLKPGMHKIAVVPALNDHAEVVDNEKEIAIDYEPTSPLPPIADVTTQGAPTVKILEPKTGDTVSGNFDVKVEVTNYKLSCDLLGKPDIAGYGHWHLNLDTTSGMMMGMATMVGMSCETTFHASTAGLDPGSTHSLIALLTDDQHVPLEPEISSKVDVKIK
jgi:hypothetical protein